MFKANRAKAKRFAWIGLGVFLLLYFASMFNCTAEGKIGIVAGPCVVGGEAFGSLAEIARLIFFFSVATLGLLAALIAFVVWLGLYAFAFWILADLEFQRQRNSYQREMD